MIVKIDATEKDAVQKSCAELGFMVSFYTIENNDLMVQAEILWEGALELKPEVAFALGKVVVYELEKRISDQKLKTLL